jgi:hypothetical protein
VKKHPDSLKSKKVDGFDLYEWSDPSQTQQQVAVSPRLMVLTDSAAQMADVLDRAAGRKKDGLPEPMRTLVAEMEQEQFGIVLNSWDVFFKALEEGLKQQAAAPQDVLADWVQQQAATWLRDFGKDVSVVSVGVRFAAEDFQLQIGLGITRPRVARERRTWIERNNFWVGLLLRSDNGEVPRLLADVLRKERVQVKGSATLIRARVPYKLVQKMLAAPGL